MDDETYMRLALCEARRAAQRDEVPVGAVIVCGGRVIARAHNQKERRRDATAHAEIAALQRAQRKLGDWHLNDCVMYVTLEPCVMCAGALVNCRIGRIVFGAYDARFGACGSVYDIAGDARLNHSCPVTGGVLREECAEILSTFFKAKRLT